MQIRCLPDQQNDWLVDERANKETPHISGSASRGKIPRDEKGQVNKSQHRLELATIWDRRASEAALADQMAENG